MTGRKTHWTPSDDEKIKDMFPRMQTKDMVQHFPDKSEDGIRRRALQLGLKQPKEFWPSRSMRYGRWTPTEDAVIEELYSSIGPQGVHTTLPHRTINAIRNRACELGHLISPKSRSNTIPYTDHIIGHLSEAEKGYFAGIIDGEGCIHFQRRPSSSGRRYTYAAKLTIVNTDVRIIQWLCDHLTGYTYSKREADTRRRATYQWNFTGTNRTIQLLSEIAPYLVGKRDQAELLSNGYQHLSLDERAALWQTMSDMKRQVHAPPPELRTTASADRIR